MCDNTGFSESTWNRFLDFLSPSIDDLSDDEVVKELKQRRISTDQLYQTIMNEIDNRIYIKQFEIAKMKRKKSEELLANLRSNISEPIEVMREKISALFTNQKIASVYFNRLKDAADEEDLITLVEDLMALDQLDGCDDD